MSDPAQQRIKSITIERQIIRANGTRELNEVVSYWDEDPELMRQVIETKGYMVQSDGTIVPKAPQVCKATPSELLLSLTREELERGM